MIQRLVIIESEFIEITGYSMTTAEGDYCNRLIRNGRARLTREVKRGAEELHRSPVQQQMPVEASQPLFWNKEKLIWMSRLLLVQNCISN